MSFVPQKTQYALRALFELAKQYGRGPVRIAEIAEAQAIPPRFLEVILGQLKRGGFVQSRRGSEGGYVLLFSPHRLTVGEVIRFLQGPMTAVDCMSRDAKGSCPLRGNCVFMPMWKRVGQALSEVYDTTSFRDLLDEEARKEASYVPMYSI